MENTREGVSGFGQTFTYKKLPPCYLSKTLLYILIYLSLCFQVFFFNFVSYLTLLPRVATAENFRTQRDKTLLLCSLITSNPWIYPPKHRLLTFHATKTTLSHIRALMRASLIKKCIKMANIFHIGILIGTYLRTKSRIKTRQDLTKATAFAKSQI